MQRSEMESLKVGDRILWIEESIPGTIKTLIQAGVEIEYDDGWLQELPFVESDRIERFAL